MNDMPKHIVLPWISVDDKLPPDTKSVFCRMAWNHAPERTVVFAGFYARRWEHEVHPEDDTLCEYHDHLDAFFLREGWYENQWNWDEYSSIAISEGKVIEWMSVPKGKDDE